MDELDLLYKFLDKGATAVVCILLIYKGVPAMYDLSNSIKDLGKVIDSLDKKFEYFDARLSGFENRIATLEHNLREDIQDLKLFQNRKHCESEL